jgi:large subunit ribosomal protein L5
LPVGQQPNEADMAEEVKDEQKKPPQQAGKGKGSEQGSKKAKKPKAEAPEAEAEPAKPAPPPRLWVRYKQEIVPALKQKLGLANALAVPRLEKIVISMGLGRFGTAGKEGEGKIEQAEKELVAIAGQKPVRCKAKKSVANFKLREGMQSGLKVTLRGARMYEFLDRLISLAIPRVKDFRGLDPKGFDRAGNYNFGLTEQTVFPEVNVADVQFQQGMNVTMVTTARKVEHGRELLSQFGMPFRTDGK